MALGNVYESNAMGAMPGFGGFGFGGFGGGGILEGILLASLLGRRGNGLFGGDGGSPDLDASGIAAKVVELQNTANLGPQIESAKANVLEAISTSAAFTAAQISAIKEQLCAISVEAVKSGLEAKIAALQATNQLSNQIEQSRVAAALEFGEIRQTIIQDGAVTRALINKDREDSLRDQLHLSREREREVNNQMFQIGQNNAMNSILVNSQNQIAAQLQALAAQVSHQTNKVVQVGAGLVSNPTATNNQIG